jgi:hypothetical protein
MEVLNEDIVCFDVKIEKLETAERYIKLLLQLFFINQWRQRRKRVRMMGCASGYARRIF